MLAAIFLLWVVPMIAGNIAIGHRKISPLTRFYGKGGWVVLYGVSLFAWRLPDPVASPTALGGRGKGIRDAGRPLVQAIHGRWRSSQSTRAPATQVISGLREGRHQASPGSMGYRNRKSSHRHVSVCFLADPLTRIRRLVEIHGIHGCLQYRDKRVPDHVAALHMFTNHGNRSAESPSRESGRPMTDTLLRPAYSVFRCGCDAHPE